MLRVQRPASNMETLPPRQVFLSAGGGGGNGTEPPPHKAHHDESSILPVFFLSFALLAATALDTVLKKLPEKFQIPYTVTMLLAGMALGTLNLLNNRTWFHDSMNLFQGLDPHLMLNIFLPALIFESAFSTSFHVIKRELSQILLLAGPGVAISMSLTAIVSRYCLDYSWPWSACFMFGAIVSATDPVAVVALLRDLGASKKLATLIEGESLFNDGTAFVFFLVAKDFVRGETLSMGEIIVTLLRLALGGPLLGFAIAIPAMAWISIVYNSPAVETTITFASAYICFWLAESSYAAVHVSGVLAVVVLGITMSHYRHFISVEAEEVVHHFWEMIGFVANTLIFLISGILVSENLFVSNQGIRPKDFGYNIMLNLFIYMIRGTSISLLSYPMARIGYGFDWRKGLVLCHGGLRGAVGLALALMVDLETEIPASISKLVLFHVAGIVLFTLIVNGLTTPNVLAAVGLDKPKAPTLRAFKEAIKRVTEASSKRAIQMCKQRVYKDADWKMVFDNLPTYENHKRRLNSYDVELAKKSPFALGFDDIKRAELHRSMAQARHVSSPSASKEGKIDRNTSTSEELLRQEATVRVLTAMSAHFHEAFEKGQISRGVIGVLEEATDSAADVERLGVVWETIDAHFHPTTFLGRGYKHFLFFLARKVPCIEESILYYYYQEGLEMIIAFVDALHVVRKIEGLFEGLHKNAYREVLAEKRKYQKIAEDRWSQIEGDYPTLITGVQTLFAVRQLLHHENRTIRRLRGEGVLSDAEKTKMIDVVKRHMYFVQHHRVGGVKFTASEVISQIPFWEHLSPEDRERLVSSRRVVVEQDQEIGAQYGIKLYFIMNGMAKVIDSKGDPKHTLGIGSLYGTWAAVTNHRYPGNAVSKSDPLFLLQINKHLVQKIMQNPAVRDMLWRQAAVDLLTSVFPDLFNTSWRKTEIMCDRGEIFEVKEVKKTVAVVRGVVLLMRGRAMKPPGYVDSSEEIKSSRSRISESAIDEADCKSDPGRSLKNRKRMPDVGTTGAQMSTSDYAIDSKRNGEVRSRKGTGSARRRGSERRDEDKLAAPAVFTPSRSGEKKIIFLRGAVYIVIQAKLSHHQRMSIVQYKTIVPGSSKGIRPMDTLVDATQLGRDLTTTRNFGRLGRTDLDSSFANPVPSLGLGSTSTMHPAHRNRRTSNRTHRLSVSNQRQQARGMSLSSHQLVPIDSAGEVEMKEVKEMPDSFQRAGGALSPRRGVAQLTHAEGHEQHSNVRIHVPGAAGLSEDSLHRSLEDTRAPESDQKQPIGDSQGIRSVPVSMSRSDPRMVVRGASMPVDLDTERALREIVDVESKGAVDDEAAVARGNFKRV